MTSPGAGLVVRDVVTRAVVVPLRRPLATRVGAFSRWPPLPPGGDPALAVAGVPRDRDSGCGRVSGAPTRPAWPATGPRRNSGAGADFPDAGLGPGEDSPRGGGRAAVVRRRSGAG